MMARECGTRFKRFWLDGHREARADIRNRWPRGAVCLWLLGLCTCLGFLYPFSMVGGRTSSACQPDGRFELDSNKYRYWSRSGFFQITLGFGELKFEQAKAIDVMWDVVFGRGGQALLAMTSWSVFVRYVTTSMEVTPVTFRTYRTIFVQDQAMLVAIPNLIYDFSTRFALHSRVAMTFMVVSMVFVWAFPTLGSAMTGYDSNVKAFLPDANKNLIPFGSLDHHLFTIHDGSRINRTDDFVVGFTQSFGDDPVYSYDPYTYSHNCWQDRDFRLRGGLFVDEPTDAMHKRLEQCDLIKNVTAYVKNHIVNPKNTTLTTTFNRTVLPLPVLNITVYYLNDKLFNRSKDETNPYDNPRRRRWVYKGEDFEESYILKNGTCQATQTYQWGFSFIQLNLMINFLVIWTIGTGLMWIRAHITMQQRGRKYIAGEHQAIIELANAMQHQITGHDFKDVNASKTINEEDLRRRINEDLRGGSIAYTAPLLAVGEDGHGHQSWGLRAFLKKEGWWLFLLLSSTAGCVTVGITLPAPFIYTWLIGLIFACALTISLGTTGRSRAMIFLWSLMLFSVVPGLSVILTAVYGQGDLLTTYYGSDR